MRAKCLFNLRAASRDPGVVKKKVEPLTISVAGYVTSKVRGRGSSAEYAFSSDRLGHVKKPRTDERLSKADSRLLASGNSADGISQVSGNFPVNRSSVSPNVLDDSSEDSLERVARAKARKLFPKDWLPTDRDRAFAREKGYSDEWIDVEAQRCRDLHIVKGYRFADHGAAIASARSRPGTRQMVAHDDRV